MRKKNKLYTVNKYNKSMFMPGNTQNENLYGFGSAFMSASGLGNLKSMFSAEGIGKSLGQFVGDMFGTSTYEGVSANPETEDTTNNGGVNTTPQTTEEQIPKAYGGPVYRTPKGNLHFLGGITGGLASAVGGAVGGLLSNGNTSTVGSVVDKVGDVVGAIPGFGTIAGAGLKVLSGGINALFGSKVDQAKLQAANKGTNAYNSFTSKAKTFDEIKMAQAQEGVQDAYSGGLFVKGDAAEKNKRLHDQRIAARQFASNAVANNISNLAADQINNAAANFSAFGGPLSFGTNALGLMQQDKYFDTIDNRSDAIASKKEDNVEVATTPSQNKGIFASGGSLESEFLDNFGSDPIGAAVRYNHGLEAMAAQEEAKQAEAAREKEYADMQKKMLQLETENQGLQAMMVAMPSTTTIPESPTPSSTPSRAISGGSTWDYIEDQLRRSGRFNDNQIQGIKYNLQRESSIDPGAIGDGGQAFGLGQWHGSRKPTDMSLEGQTRHLIETISNFDGKDHWIRRSDYEGFLNARTPEEAHYYLAKGYERPRADIVAKVKRDSDMSLGRKKAFGGELGTNGTDWTNGLLYIDEGGSHESNPFDGVPMGLDPQGIPNLVEEGETVYNNYVFSDRMKVPFFMYKELGLGGVMKKKGKKMSFADASKKLAQESEQRPNDPISQAGLDASLSKLAEIQETERMRKQAKEYMGLEGYACGGKLGNKYWGPGDEPQQITSLFGNNRFLIDFSKYNNPPQYYQPFNAEAWRQVLNINPGKSNSTREKTKEQSRTKSSADTSTGGSRNNYGQSETNGPTLEEESPFYTDDEEFVPVEEIDFFDPNFGDPEVKKAADNAGYYEGWKDSEYRGKENTPKSYPTWMRYAPAVGAGIMTLTDALGLTNKPDYTYADKIAGAAERAGYAPKVAADPIGNYLRYNPMDIWYQQNAMNAQARATDRALANTSSPSRAAGLLANGYNSQLASGNLYRQALEYNDAKRKEVEDFNRKTNMFNSQMGLEADMANARYHQVAQQMGLSGLAQAAALREQIDARTGAAKSANLTNFLTSLGNIGRENFAMNQLNWDRSRHYTTDASGKSGYKKKCGGKMNRK